jgi:hypothetical protein
MAVWNGHHSDIHEQGTCSSGECLKQAFASCISALSISYRVASFDHIDHQCYAFTLRKGLFLLLILLLTCGGSCTCLLTKVNFLCAWVNFFCHCQSHPRSILIHMKEVSIFKFWLLNKTILLLSCRWGVLTKKEIIGWLCFSSAGCFCRLLLPYHRRPGFPIPQLESTWVPWRPGLWACKFESELHELTKCKIWETGMASLKPTLSVWCPSWSTWFDLFHTLGFLDNFLISTPRLCMLMPSGFRWQTF